MISNNENYLDLSQSQDNLKYSKDILDWSTKEFDILSYTRNHHVLIRSKVHPNLQIEIPSEDDYFPRTTANTTPSEIQYNNQVTRSCYSILSIFLLCSPSSLKQYKTKDTNNTTISTKYPKKRETNYFASTRSFYEYKPRHDETILHIRSTELEIDKLYKSENKQDYWENRRERFKHVPYNINVVDNVSEDHKEVSPHHIDSSILDNTIPVDHLILYQQMKKKKEYENFSYVSIGNKKLFLKPLPEDEKH